MTVLSAGINLFQSDRSHSGCRAISLGLGFRNTYQGKKKKKKVLISFVTWSKNNWCCTLSYPYAKKLHGTRITYSTCFVIISAYLLYKLFIQSVSSPGCFYRVVKPLWDMMSHQPEQQERIHQVKLRWRILNLMRMIQSVICLVHGVMHLKFAQVLLQFLVRSTNATSGKGYSGALDLKTETNFFYLYMPCP